MGVYKGYKQTEEHKKNAVLARRKNNSYKHTEKTKKKMSELKLKNPTKYWLGKKRPEMKNVKGWNHKGETWEEMFGEEKAKKRREFMKTEEYSEIARRNGLKAKQRKVSKAELILKDLLERNNIDFIHQFKFKLGIADFYIPSKNLIVECYGDYWHSKPDYIIRDSLKNRYLLSQGYNLLILSSEKIVKKLIPIKSH